MTSLPEYIIRLIDWFYIAPVASLISRQTFRYAVCGGTNMIADTMLYFVTYNFIIAKHNIDLGLVVISPYIASLCIVFPITFFNGFWLNRHVAFRSSSSPASVQLWRYALSVAGALLLNYFCMKFLVEVCHIWPTPSKLLTTIITVGFSYIAARFFTFRNAPIP